MVNNQYLNFLNAILIVNALSAAFVKHNYRCNHYRYYVNEQTLNVDRLLRSLCNLLYLYLYLFKIKLFKKKSSLYFEKQFFYNIIPFSYMMVIY